jgi:uncharacterized repeat protein (TIGR01451 family)
VAPGECPAAAPVASAPAAALAPAGPAAAACTAAAAATTALIKAAIPGAAGGGGGGSNLVPPGGTSALRTDPAQLTISYQAPAAPADLVPTNTGSPNPVLSGQRLTYTIKATNTGGQTATGASVSDPLPASVVFRSMSTSQGSCQRTAGGKPKTKNGTVTCGVGDLAADASATVTIVVTPTTKGTLSDTATVTASNVIQDSYDSATATLIVKGN